MSGTGEIAKPAPRKNFNGTPARPAPTLGSHPKGGAHIDTVVSDTGMSQQQQQKG